MARYIDADTFMERLKASPAFSNMGMDGYFLLDVVEELLKKFPAADVVPRVELDAMRGAANSYKMHYEEAKQEADRLAVELEAEKVLREVRVERIFEEIEMLMKKHIFPVVREGAIEIEREPFLIIDPQDWAVLKSRHTFDGSSRAPTPTGEDEGGVSDG